MGPCLILVAFVLFPLFGRSCTLGSFNLGAYDVVSLS